jgi:hypothetical protein
MIQSHYSSGEEIRKGDYIEYDGETGMVDFVASERTGDAALDWYLDEFPGGGVMLNVKPFGALFLATGDIDGRLKLLRRENQTGRT